MTYRSLLTPVTLLALAAPLEAQGFRYSFEMTAKDDSTRGRVTWIGSRGRIDMEPGSGQPHDRTYVLLREGGRTLISVDPSRREYNTIPDTTFERIVGVALESVGDVITIELEDHTVVGERLGPGEPVAGHATVRYRITQDFTVRIGVPFVTDPRIHQTVVTEYWVASDVNLIHNPVLELLAGVETALAQRDATFMRKTRAARRGLFTGTPLRIVVRSTTEETDGDGTETEATTRTIEITEIASARVDPASLEVPAGYKAGDDFTWPIPKKQRI